MRAMTRKTCRTCILGEHVPGVTIDHAGMCSECNAYRATRPVYDAYFRERGELETLLRQAPPSPDGYRVLLMYSGGKDSTYVLYMLKDMGFRTLAVTFDNGFVPKACFDNIAQVCRDAGVESRIVNIPQDRMNGVFVDSLKNDSTVCPGCFRGLTARGSELAIAEQIPVVMTGLSRGQILQTKLAPLVSRSVTDPDTMDRYLAGYRRLYHGANDRISTLIDDRAMQRPELFEKLSFIDYFRYSDVTRKEIVAYLEHNVPFWKKPENVGACSSNCMINDVGTFVHLRDKGYHNYEVPTAWEVRTGHLSRDAAFEEIGSEIDEARVRGILNRIGYHDDPVAIEVK